MLSLSVVSGIEAVLEALERQQAEQQDLLGTHGIIGVERRDSKEQL